MVGVWHEHVRVRDRALQGKGRAWQGRSGHGRVGQGMTG